MQGRVGALERSHGQALSAGLIRMDKGRVRRQLKLMAGSTQGGAWAIKICSNTALIMSVITDQTVTKGLSHCVLQHRAELGILGQPLCELWPLYRERHVQMSWIEKRGGHRTFEHPSS